MSAVLSVDTLELERITLRYDASEDRIRIDGVSRSGEQRGLWLTRRLVSRLVLFFLQHAALFGQSDDDLLDETKRASAKLVDASEVPVPVALDENSPSYLVSELDLTRLENQILMKFKAPDSRTVTCFMLPYTSICDWLSGLRTCCQMGDWKVPVSESVIKERSEIALPGGRLTLH
jgi:hypothetical protein